MTKNTGGSAFATGNPTHGGERGMTLRDWFAGQAMANLDPPVHYVGYSETEEEYREYAKRVYRIADAMIAEREKDQ